VRKIVRRGGKCLLPVFSAGRAEELLFILDEFWDENFQELQHIKIFYTIELI
jgi:cleavage and polyadenylation specificity factor subunit 3